MMTFPYLKEKYHVPGFYIDVPYEKNQEAIEYVAEQLREIWRKVLNADDSLDIEAETNFFEAGGDSLLLGLLNIMIEKQIGRKLRIETFFEHQTFGGMVRAIQAEPAV